MPADSFSWVERHGKEAKPELTQLIEDMLPQVEFHDMPEDC